MSGYTITNLKDEVEDQAPKFGFAPDLEARFARGSLGLEKSGISYQRLAPGFRIPFGHKHKEQEEVYVVVGGSGRVKIDDEVLDFRQWDVIRCGPGTWRCFESGPDGAEIVAFGAPYVEDRQAEAEMKPGWWAED